MLITVKCDKCGWELEKQDIHKWLNVPCPACNDYIPITKIDVTHYRAMMIIKAIDRFVCLFLPKSVKKKTVKVSSKDLRGKYERSN